MYIIRICFLIEQAFWFYVQHHASREDDKTERIKEFAAHIFR